MSPQSAGHWRLVWPLPYYLLSAVQYRNSPCATQTHEGRARAGTAPVVHAFVNAFANSNLTAAVRAAPQSMHKLRGAWMVLTALTFGVCWRMERRARSVFECFIRCTAVCRSCTRRRLRSDGQQRRCKVRRAECTQPSGISCVCHSVWCVCALERVLAGRHDGDVSKSAKQAGWQMHRGTALCAAQMCGLAVQRTPPSHLRQVCGTRPPRPSAPCTSHQTRTLQLAVAYKSASVPIRSTHSVLEADARMPEWRSNLGGNFVACESPACAV